MSTTRKILLPVLLLTFVALFCFDYGRFVEFRHFRAGVNLFRQGYYKAAQEQFATVDGGAAHYNRGNCLVRMAEQAVAECELSGRYYAAAIDAYGAALLLHPGEADTKHNLDLAMAARAGLRNEGQDKHLPEKTADGAGQGAASGKKKEPTAADRTGQVGSATGGDEGKGALRKKAMTRDQVERLLAEKRGSNLLPSAMQASSTGRPSAPPLKDW